MEYTKNGFGERDVLEQMYWCTKNDDTQIPEVKNVTKQISWSDGWGNKKTWSEGMAVVKLDMEF